MGPSATARAAVSPGAASFRRKAVCQLRPAEGLKNPGEYPAKGPFGGILTAAPKKAPDRHPSPSELLHLHLIRHNYWSALRSLGWTTPATS